MLRISVKDIKSGIFNIEIFETLNSFFLYPYATTFTTYPRFLYFAIYMWNTLLL